MFAAWAAFVGARVTKYVAVIGFVLAAFWAAWFKGRTEGAAIARARALEAEVKAAGERANAEICVDREPDPIGRLRKDWPRK